MQLAWALFDATTSAAFENYFAECKANIKNIFKASRQPLL